MYTEFHFLRPFWLFLIPITYWLIFRVYNKLIRIGNFENIIEPHLLKFLATQPKKKGIELLPWIMSISSTLILLALAGPVWEKTPQPLFQKSLARVIVLDLSYSMLATDIRPTRIDRIRYKLDDLLKRLKEGETGLIGYAGEAFVISPLTHDPKTILSLLQGLSPNIMPVPGSHTENAIELASELLKRSNKINGHIILVTDGIEDKNISRIKNAMGSNSLSIIAVGTESGSPIALKGGGFLKDKTGAIVIHKLKTQPLIKLANETNGTFSVMSLNDDDVDKIIEEESIEKEFDEEKNNMNSDVWNEEGPLLLLIALPLSALLFRRGLLFSCILPMVVGVSFFPYSTNAFEWDDLWMRIDQQAAKLLQEGKMKDAAQLFENKEWKGVASYRSREYDSAIQYFSKKNSIRAKFNLGNSLAMSGRFQEAIETYEKVLLKNPEYHDAKFNKDLIKKYLEERQKKKLDANNEVENDKPEEQNNISKTHDGKKKSSKQEHFYKNKNSNSNQENEFKNISKKKQSATNDNKEKLNDEKAEFSKILNKQKSNNITPGKKVDLDENKLNIEHQSKVQALEQWLRKIPDDPGRLLRNKMQREYNRRRKSQMQNEYNW